MKKKRMILFVFSSILLLLSYYLVGHILFDSHGMNDWPLVMLAICTTIMLISFAFFYHIAAISSAMSYSLGYGLGFIFQSNGLDQGEGATNNLWIIWLICTLIICFIGYVIEPYYLKKNKPIIF